MELTAEQLEQNTQLWHQANRNCDFKRADELKLLGINPIEINSGKSLKELLQIEIDADTAWLEAYLRDKHTHIDIQDINGETAFTRAMKRNNPMVAGILLSEGANINHQNINGDTALSIACKNNDAASVKYLLSKSADINIQNDEGETALRLSIKEQIYNKVEGLLGIGANLDLQDSDGRTSLMNAIEYQHNDIAELLIESGANLELEDKHGNTALMYACQNGEAILVELLVRNGADINHSNHYAETPLIKSLVLHDETSKGIVARLLIDLGADVNAKTMNGRTALMIAVEKSMDPSFTELLIDRHADINQRDVIGRTALMMTARNTESSENAELLIAKGAETEIVDRHGDCPLSIACKGNNLSLAEALLKSGVDVDVVDGKTQTMLMHASEKGNTELMKILIKHGADINKQDVTGKTALMYSTGSLDEDGAKLLIDHGAIIDLQDNKGQTAAMLAVCGFNPSLAEYLKASGADTHNLRDKSGKTVQDHMLEENAASHAFMDGLELEKNISNQEDIAIIGPSLGGITVQAPVIRQQTEREKYMDSLFPVGDTEEFHRQGFDEDTVAARCELKLMMVDDLTAKGINQEYISKEDLDKWTVQHQTEKFVGQFVQDFGVDPVIVENQKLFTACINGDVEAIKSSSADFNCKDDLGNTPLMLAARNGQAEIISFLVENQAYLNTKNSLGDTALLISCKEGHSVAAQSLINRGADFGIKDIYGDTALVIANRLGDQTTSALLMSKGAVVEYNYRKFFETCKSGSPARIAQMISDGYNINHQDRQGGTALMLALSCKQNSNAEMLVKQGANLDIQTSSGTTALMHAVINDIQQDNLMPKLLINSGANIHLTNANGDTALSFAAAHNRLDAAISLVQNGADHNQQNGGGRSAWDIIKDKDYSQFKGMHSLFEKTELSNMIAKEEVKPVWRPMSREEQETERMITAIAGTAPLVDMSKAEKIFDQRQKEIARARDTGLDISM
jgi:ankyrin repeat protein